jgi:hypothetical protein
VWTRDAELSRRLRAERDRLFTHTAERVVPASNAKTHRRQPRWVRLLSKWLAQYL